MILAEKYKQQVSLLHYVILPCSNVGCAIVEAVIYRLLTMETRVQSQDIPCGIYAGQNADGTGYSWSTSVFPYQ
jgi:hypothetical protein